MDINMTPALSSPQLASKVYAEYYNYSIDVIFSWPCWSVWIAVKCDPKK